MSVLTVLMNGSSPLTRGKLAVNTITKARAGLIPAHAGKTGVCALVGNAERAHPRSRGENCSIGRQTLMPAGSSPLTRGKLSLAASRRTPRRLIPAHAGKTIYPDPSRSALEAHPRSRGENTAIARTVTDTMGSSPLTRGKHRAGRFGGVHVGLIPAHAGKTSAPPRWARLRRAHPRSRGENGRKGGAMPGFTRLIPAHAGKTWAWSRRARPPRAHPRSRGENTAQPGREGRVAGSSPLTRGKRSILADSVLAHRLIPAHAGKTQSMHSLTCSASAHPRSRGENGTPTATWDNTVGSSPLTRGKPRRSTRPQQATRLIPAHAGKTLA